MKRSSALNPSREGDARDEIKRRGSAGLRWHVCHAFHLQRFGASISLSNPSRGSHAKGKETAARVADAKGKRQERDTERVFITPERTKGADVALAAERKTVRPLARSRVPFPRVAIPTDTRYSTRPAGKTAAEIP